jgi:hypothetical protein
MEWWRERHPIVRANQEYDYRVAPYQRGEGYCGEPTKAFQSQRPLCIHYERGLCNTKRYDAFMWHVYDKKEVVVGEEYAISGNSFDPSESSLSSVD